MNTPNSGRTVLVTGASRGIGRAIAERLGTEGYGVVVHFRSGATEADAVIDPPQGSPASWC